MPTEDYFHPDRLLGRVARWSDDYSGDTQDTQTPSNLSTTGYVGNGLLMRLAGNDTDTLDGTSYTPNSTGGASNMDAQRTPLGPLPTIMSEYDPNTGLTIPLIVRGASDSSSYSINYLPDSADVAARKAQSTLEVNQLYDQVMGTVASDVMPTLGISNPNRAQLAYGTVGHYYTEYFVDLKSGLPLDDAHKMAFGVQLPDQLGGLDAITNAIQDVTGAYPGATERRVLYQGGLHDLTGGDAEKQLQDLLLNMSMHDDLTDPLSIGLRRHPLGDDYAHRTLSDPSVMYSPLTGHLKDGTLPDEITHRPELYFSYVGTLSDANSALLNLPSEQAQAIKSDTISSLRDIVNNSLVYDPSGELNRRASEDALLQNMRSAVLSEIQKRLPADELAKNYIESPESQAPHWFDGPGKIAKNLYDFSATNPGFDRNTPMSVMENRAAEVMNSAQRIAQQNMNSYQANASIATLVRPVQIVPSDFVGALAPYQVYGKVHRDR